MSEYKAIWIMLSKISDEDLQRAYQFYLKSPDSQYDLIAAQCIKAIQIQRKKDRF